MKSTAVSLMIAIATVGFTAAGCGAREQEETTLPKSEFKFGKEPQFAISKLSALPKATPLDSIPYLATSNGVPKDETCFLATKEAQFWDTQNPVVLKQLKAMEAEIETAVLAWTRDTLYPERTFSFHARFEAPVIKHVSPAQVRLSPQQKCVDNVAMLFPNGARTITTQFGAEEFFYESKSPIDQQLIKKMEPKAKAAKCLVKALPYDYPQAIDTKGKPLKDAKGRPQFKGPNGELLNKKDIPKLKKRPVFKWSLTCHKPVFFAVGDLQADAWSSEADPAKCSVNLIYWDATPRVPECPEFNDAGFGVEQITEQNAVKVKVTADGETVSQTIPFNERQAIQISGRMVVWVVATPIEEGALLSIDSFVIAPNSGDKTLLESWKNKNNKSAKNPSSSAKSPSSSAKTPSHKGSARPEAPTNEKIMTSY